MTHSKKVLVTGSLGFTGRHLTKALELKGYDVAGIDAHANTSCYQCDLRDVLQIEQVLSQIKPDYVIHLAAISFVAESDESKFYDVNVTGTFNLLKSLAAHEPEKVILASSANVYGDPGCDKPISENASLSPISHYAVSKLAMEYMAQIWFQKLPIIITRPFNYIGSGQKQQFLLPKLAYHFRRRSAEISLGNLNIIRDFSSVGDIVDAYIKLLESDISGEVINICSGTAVSLKQIIDMMRILTGHDPKVVSNEEFQRVNEISVLVGDNSKLKQLTTWSSREPIEEVIRNMLLNE